MVQTLDALVEHLNRQGKPAKIVIWAHNSHLGDARATEMSRRGEINLGQLIRERRGDGAVLVGFSTYSGSVTAASDWGGVVERKSVRPALPGSFEQLFHGTDLPAFSLILTGMEASLSELRRERLERAIGVIYRPETERISHYFFARLMDQFDAVLHFDQTRAVEPLELTSEWETGEVPETFPTGF
jgi:erythromycin esterase-like protein